MRKLAIIIVISLLLAGYTWSAFQQEALRANGRQVLVAIAPVDPRALLMGDYMDLEYAMNADVNRALAQKYGETDQRIQHEDQMRIRYAPSLWPSQGLAIVRITHRPDQPHEGEKNAAPHSADLLVFDRLDDGSPLAEGEHYLLYRVQGQRAHITTPAFYFEEGFAYSYAKARYGVLRLGADGRHLLVNLADYKGRSIR